MTPFVPPDFEVPAGFETPDFRVRMLAISDVVKDYDAVMTSVERLRKVFSPSGRWPKGLSFEQDLIDLGWHHKEFQQRRSFAYTVMSLDEAVCLSHRNSAGISDGSPRYVVRSSSILRKSRKLYAAEREVSLQCARSIPPHLTQR